MSRMSRFGKKLGDIADNASKKSGELMETAKINAEISRLQADIEDLQFELGQAYYADNAHNTNSPYASILEQIAQCEEEIRIRDKRLLAQKGMRYCPYCQAIIERESEFCNKCGERVPKFAQESKADTCRNCGGAMEQGKPFCPACGFYSK